MDTNKELKKQARTAIAGSRTEILKTSAVTLLLGGVNLLCFFLAQIIMFISSSYARNNSFPELTGFFRWSYLLLFLYVLVSIVMGSFVELGYNRIMLLKLKGSAVPKGTLFYCRPIWINAMYLRLYMAAKVILWTLVFTIPGIIAMFNYSMAPYLMAQNPRMSPPEAVRISKYLMRGYKKQLFKLLISFADEIFISIITLGIPFIAVIPRIKVAVAAFYRSRVHAHDIEIERSK